MAGIGEDIKSVIRELGTPFTINHIDGSVVTGEYLDYEMYFDTATEFVRQWCYSGDFHFDSAVVPGDILYFDDKYFLVLNVKRSLFENSVVEHSNFFVECNCLGHFSRVSEVRDPVTKKISTNWISYQSGVHSLMINVQISSTDEEFKNMTVFNNKYNLMVPGYTTIKVNDRWYPDSSDLTTYYRVENINKFRFNGVFVMILVEDSRE